MFSTSELESWWVISVKNAISLDLSLSFTSSSSKTTTLNFCVDVRTHGVEILDRFSFQQSPVFFPSGWNLDGTKTQKNPFDFHFLSIFILEILKKLSAWIFWNNLRRKHFVKNRSHLRLVCCRFDQNSLGPINKNIRSSKAPLLVDYRICCCSVIFHKMWPLRMIGSWFILDPCISYLFSWALEYVVSRRISIPRFSAFDRTVVPHVLGYFLWFHWWFLDFCLPLFCRTFWTFCFYLLPLRCFLRLFFLIQDLFFWFGVIWILLWGIFVLPRHLRKFWPFFALCGCFPWIWAGSFLFDWVPIWGGYRLSCW